MKEFMLIFRLKAGADFKPSPAQMQERMNWLASIAAQEKLVDQGKTLLPTIDSGRHISADQVVTDGPFTELKEYVSGFIVVRTENIDEAVSIAKQNPIFKIGGSIEVRELLKS